MKNSIISFIAGFILLPVFLSAQNEIPVFAGIVKSIDFKDHSVKIVAENACAEIFAYSPTVLRIRITRKEAKDDFSYAVIQSPGAGMKKISDPGKMTVTSAYHSCILPGSCSMQITG